MIKVDVDVEKPKEQKLTFPALMQREDGLVVLFSTYDHGTVVVSNKCASRASFKYLVGDYRDNWPDARSPSNWAKFPGKITLSNQDE